MTKLIAIKKKADRIRYRGQAAGDVGCGQHGGCGMYPAAQEK